MRIAAGALLLLGLCAPAGAASSSWRLTYELASIGLPIMRLEFNVNEAEDAYRINGVIRSSGVADFFSRFLMRTESDGVVSGERLLPRAYASDSQSRRHRRQARLQFGPDGGVAALVDPPLDPAQERPPDDAVRGSFDPLSGILELGHIAAHQGSCATRIPIFDGRRRYDVVFADHPEPKTVTGDRRGPMHCAVAVIKVAGFSGESEPTAHVDHAEAWIAAFRPGAPLLPVRVEFSGSWGPISVSLIEAAPGR